MCYCRPRVKTPCCGRASCVKACARSHRKTLTCDFCKTFIPNSGTIEAYVESQEEYQHLADAFGNLKWEAFTCSEPIPVDVFLSYAPDGADKVTVVSLYCNVRAEAENRRIANWQPDPCVSAILAVIGVFGWFAILLSIIFQVFG